MIREIKRGILRRRGRLLASSFLAYSALWTVIESVGSLVPGAKLEGASYYISLVIISFLVGCYQVYQPEQVIFRVKNSNTRVRIFFGDIFKQSGVIAIPVNEYFDSELGKLVSPETLHGVVIKKYFGGHSLAFDKAVQDALNGRPFDGVQRDQGKVAKYPIGTSIVVHADDKNFLLFALCRTNVLTKKATADLSDMVAALIGLYTAARYELNGSKLSIPLVGSGLSGVGLPETHLLQVILMVLVHETKKQQVSKEVDIILHESLLDEIDLELIRNQWS